jgi:hypothetical protein
VPKWSFDQKILIFGQKSPKIGQLLVKTLARAEGF